MKPDIIQNFDTTIDLLDPLVTSKKNTETFHITFNSFNGWQIIANTNFLELFRYYMVLETRNNINSLTQELINQLSTRYVTAPATVPHTKNYSMAIKISQMEN